jgi:hypothetical protein
MRGSQVPLRDAVPADSPGHGHTRNDGRLVIRGNRQLPLITSGYGNGPPPPTPNLATLRGAEHASTRRTYGRILRWIVTEFGSDNAPGIDPERFAAWFTAQWAGRSPSTWNVSLDAISPAAA